MSGCPAVRLSDETKGLPPAVAVSPWVIAHHQTLSAKSTFESESGLSMLKIKIQPFSIQFGLKF